MDASGSGQGLVTGSCEHGEGPSGTMNVVEGRCVVPCMGFVTKGMRVPVCKQ
jgi:hypothetical protein